MPLKSITYTTDELIEDFTSLQTEICSKVEGLTEVQWSKPSLAATWSNLDCLGHLVYFDEVMSLAFEDPTAFLQLKDDHSGNEVALMDFHINRFRQLGAHDTIEAFKSNHDKLKTSFKLREPDLPIKWFGPDMKPTTAIISRVMEYWAHSQDIYDALGFEREASNATMYIAELGVKTFKWSFKINNLDEPLDKLFVELGFSGQSIEIGNTAASNKITGDITDFCLLVTQRRNIRDLNLQASGKEAEEFLEIAQCFAGQKGLGRKPLSSD